MGNLKKKKMLKKKFILLSREKWKCHMFLFLFYTLPVFLAFIEFFVTLSLHFFPSVKKKVIVCMIINFVYNTKTEEERAKLEILPSSRFISHFLRFPNCSSSMCACAQRTAYPHVCVYLGLRFRTPRTKH